MPALCIVFLLSKELVLVIIYAVTLVGNPDYGFALLLYLLMALALYYRT